MMMIPYYHEISNATSLTNPDPHLEDSTIHKSLKHVVPLQLALGSLT